MMLIDTSGFFSLHVKTEPDFALSNKLYNESRNRLTTNYILAEYVALALVRGVSRIDAIRFSRRALKDKSFELVWIDLRLHEQAVTLLENRDDKAYSLCDAVSFIVMREHGIAEALTTDRHFEQEGFTRLLT